MVITPKESRVFPQENIGEDHDKDWWTEDDGWCISHRQMREADKDADHRKAADQAWNWLIGQTN